MKLLGLFLIRCVFTKKNLGDQKVKTGTGKSRGFPEHCALFMFFYVTKGLFFPRPGKVWIL